MDIIEARKQGRISWWEEQVLVHVDELGGFYNAHAHFCRAGTLEPKYLEHIGTTPLEASSFPLSVKQNLVGDLHRGIAYTRENLYSRMLREVEQQIAFGTTRLDTNIDATPDLPDEGLLAINVMLEVREKIKEQHPDFQLRIAPTPIFGFKEGTGRWETFKRAALLCDYLSGLPEKDDHRGRSEPGGKIGFREAIKRVLELGCELKKEVQFHLDQANNPNEAGTETLLEGLRWLGQPELSTDGPSVWVIHMISPSAYDENRFRKVVDGLLEHNVGVIVCPSAAISMRQLRPLTAPTHNSLARILELLRMEVPVRLGTDNIADVFVPQSDGDMLTEVKIGSNAVRLASPSIWAKLATGTPLNNVDIASVGRALYEDRKAFSDVAPSGWKFAID